MIGFFSDSAIKSKEAEELWTSEAEDRLLDMHIDEGMHPVRMAVELHRPLDSVRRRIWEFKNDRRDDKPIDYVPVYRASRIGKRCNQNELIIIRNYKKKNLPMKKLAPLLQRTLWEIKKIWNELE